MIILSVKTDNPEAELSVFDEGKQVAHYKWHAHRQLAESLQIEIEKLLKSCDISLKDLDGIVAYKGPGSFTGLRIGLSVANALAYGLDVPIVGSSGASWETIGLKKIDKGINEVQALPEYGSPAHVTTPKK